MISDYLIISDGCVFQWTLLMLDTLHRLTSWA